MPYTKNNAQSIKDLIIILILNILLFLLFADLDVLEIIYQYSRTHEDWELDELIPIFFSLTLCFAVFSYRRWKELIIISDHALSLSLIDPLTQLHNRRALQQQLDVELARAKRNKTALCAILLDLDNFKKINDVYGHAVGDEVLVSAALKLKQACRQVDFCSRWGGEEFMLLCPNTSAQQAEHLAKKLKKIMCFTIKDNHVVSASFGIAELQTNETFDALLSRADHALYQAKDAGKNCIIVAKTSTVA